MSVIKGGDSGNVANVNSDKQLATATVSETSIEFASRVKEKSYSWASTYAASGGDEVISIQNTSTMDDLVIDGIEVGGSGATVYTVFKATSGTAAGTGITGLNLNTGSTNPAIAAAFGNASVTGSLAGDKIGYTGISAASEFHLFDLKGSVILGQNQAMAVTTSAAVTAYVTVFGHYK